MCAVYSIIYWITFNDGSTILTAALNLNRDKLFFSLNCYFQRKERKTGTDGSILYTEISKLDFHKNGTWWIKMYGSYGYHFDSYRETIMWDKFYYMFMEEKYGSLEFLQI